jgi:hypothetical protein
MSLPTEILPFSVERRSGLQRRHGEPQGLRDPYRADDRRLGLGRRWEDWCRPARPSSSTTTRSPQH